MVRPMFFPFLGAVMLLLAGCGGGGDAGGGTDRITISSVTPTVASAGTATDYSLDLSYDLQTSGSGIINIGFKPASSAVYSLETDSRLIDKGSGTVRFVVNKTLSENHDLRAHLSEHPHLQSWTPLDSDSYRITVN